MKKLSLLILLALSTALSGYANADDNAVPGAVLCESKNLPLLKEVAYDLFLRNSGTKKHRFTYVYSKASAAMSAAITAGCKANSDTTNIISEAETSCEKSCDKTATGMFNNENFGIGKNKKEKELFNECAGNCSDAWSALWFYILGATAK